MTASRGRSQRPRPRNRLQPQTQDQPVYRDSGGLSGRGHRHAERAPDQRWPAGSPRRTWLWLRRGLLDSHRAQHGDHVQRRLRLLLERVVTAHAEFCFPAAAIFTVASALLPFAPSYWAMLALVVIAGLASGTFYSLTMTFVLTTLPKRLIIFGIAAYAADIVFVSNIASALEGWYIEHLSWHWIFWNAALFTPLMMICVYFGIPRRPITEPEAELARIRLFQPGPQPSLRRSRSGRAAGLAELRRDRRDVGCRNFLWWCRRRKAVPCSRIRR